jgi:hypothetical protein
MNILYPSLRRTTFLLGLLAATNVSFAQQVSIHKNETSGLLTWTVQDQGFQVEFIQLLPDFIRAIYAKHGFPKAEIERAADYCMFGTILKNTSDKVMSYRVKDWRYRTSDGKLWPVKTKSQWLDEWRKQGIIFSWTLLPDEGEFAEGDWQQGFTTIKAPRESSFDLIYTWQLDGKPYQGTLKNMQCPPATIEIDEAKGK